MPGFHLQGNHSTYLEKESKKAFETSQWLVSKVQFCAANIPVSRADICAVLCMLTFME